MALPQADAQSVSPFTSQDSEERSKFYRNGPAGLQIPILELQAPPTTMLPGSVGSNGRHPVTATTSVVVSRTVGTTTTQTGVVLGRSGGASGRSPVGATGGDPRTGPSADGKAGPAGSAEPAGMVGAKGPGGKSEPQRFPLNRSWSFWYRSSKTVETQRARVRAAGGGGGKDEAWWKPKKLYDFRYAQDFWRLWNNLPRRPSDLPAGQGSGSSRPA